MSILRIDFETRSACELKDSGAHVYAVHPTTDIWCMAWAFDDDEPEIWHPATKFWPAKPIPGDVVVHIAMGEELHAWNAQFERLIWRAILAPKYGFPLPRKEQYHCSMAQAAAYGLPLQLEYAAKVMNSQEEKDEPGSRLMKQMAKPRKRNDDGTFTWWDDDPEKFQKLYEYCKQDVRAERAISKRLKPLPPDERRIYLLDQTINDRGVFLDVPLAQAAVKCAEIATEQANNEIAELTGGAVKAVTEVIGITSWIQEQGVECDSISKDSIAKLITTDLPDQVRAVLQIRTDAGKSSVAKIQKMLDYAAVDGRMRGMLQYCGASGTGRWAGRGPQPQNYPRGTVAEIEELLELIASVNVAGLSLFGSPLEILSSALRPLLCAEDGARLMAADFAAIEARVLAWLAGQEDLLDMFRSGKDVYKALATKIYNTPENLITKLQRFFGKTAVLQLGYQAGHVGFHASCEKGGATIQLYSLDDIAVIREKYEGELERNGKVSPYMSKLFREAIGYQSAGPGVGAYGVVQTYRQENDRIVAFWKLLEEQVLAAVRGVDVPDGMIGYYREDDWLMCELPSGRTIKYAKPRIIAQETPWGKTVERVQVMAFNNMTRKWERLVLYGGLLAENVTQAVARDLMAEAMVRVENAGYPVILTVHDEVVSEVTDRMGTVQEFESLMTVVPAWAAGCPVAAEAWEGKRYRK